MTATDTTTGARASTSAAEMRDQLQCPARRLRPRRRRMRAAAPPRTARARATPCEALAESLPIPAGAYRRSLRVAPPQLVAIAISRRGTSNHRIHQNGHASSIIHPIIASPSFAPCPETMNGVARAAASGPESLDRGSSKGRPGTVLPPPRGEPILSSRRGSTTESVGPAIPFPSPPAPSAQPCQRGMG